MTDTIPFDIDIDTEPGTGSSGVRAYEAPTQTMATLTRQYGMLRDRTTLLDADVGAEHRETQLQTLELLAKDRARNDVASLLRELAERRGLGWSTIARLVGVSVQAVRKWRFGEAATPQHRLSLARIASLLEMLAAVPIVDVAGWLELPLVDGYSTANLDLFAADRADLLFDLIGHRIEPEQAMAEFDPDWASRYRLEHEVFEAEDGQRSIRHRR